MTQAHDMDHPGDPELVAFLDGELSPADRARVAERIAADCDLQRRLILLSGGNRPFREAFEPLLEAAPRERLEAMLQGLPVGPNASRPGAPPARRWTRIAAAVAAGLVLFLSGLAADRLVPGLGELGGAHVATGGEEERDDDWRQAVAQYLTLYTADTLAEIPEDAPLRERELAAISARVGVTLSPAAVALPGVPFKRAQLFAYDGRPLGQIMYLDPATGPVALCIFGGGESSAGPRTEERLGFNVVHWSRDGRSFMLIGRAPPERLQAFADDLAKRLAG